MTVAAPISVVILTHNESENLGSCLDSLHGVTDDIHIVDSGSTDDTVQLANQRGVPVHHHAFDGFGSQRNWAIDHVPHKYPWVFHLDADEHFTPELADEIADRISGNESEAGFFVPHKLMLCGRWLKHSGGYPTCQVRLFHRDRLRFSNHGHGQREEAAGPVGYLRQPYLHHAFAKGLDHWFAKHARYARLEAEQYARGHSFGEHADGSAEGRSDWNDLICRDPIRRRRALKRLSYCLPMRPFFRMLHVLLVQRGILDGSAGFAYARLLATYESMVAAHLTLLRSGLAEDENKTSMTMLDRHSGRNGAIDMIGATLKSASRNSERQLSCLNGSNADTRIPTRKLD